MHTMLISALWEFMKTIFFCFRRKIGESMNNKLSNKIAEVFLFQGHPQERYPTEKQYHNITKKQKNPFQGRQQMHTLKDKGIGSFFFSTFTNKKGQEPQKLLDVNPYPPIWLRGKHLKIPIKTGV